MKIEGKEYRTIWFDKEKCFETAYDRDKTWPAESIKRYNEHLETIK